MSTCGCREQASQIEDWALNDITLERADREMVELSIRVDDVK